MPVSAYLVLWERLVIPITVIASTYKKSRIISIGVFILALILNGSFIIPFSCADIITLKDGSTYEGIIGAEDSKTILLAVPGQMPLKIQKSTIKSIEKKRPEIGISGSCSNEVDDLKFLSCGDYYKELKRVLPAAKKSIQVMMFFIHYEGKPGYPANELVNLLVDAQKRGVNVEVLLESSSTEENITEANRRAAKFLDKNGVDVKIYPYYPIMHVKLIIIDKYISIVGSHNWTLASTRSNVESSVLIESEKVASQYEKYFRKSFKRAFLYQEVDK